MDEFIQTLLGSPQIGIAVLVVAVILGKVLKLAKKAFFALVCIAGAYAIVTFSGLF